jgi:hypothetical protein
MSTMTASDQKEPPPAETVTAAILVIGDEILSGRTKEKNSGTIADHLTAIGIALHEIRVVADEEPEIIFYSRIVTKIGLFQSCFSQTSIQRKNCCTITLIPDY